MTDNSIKNKRIARNTSFLYIRMFIALIVNLYTSRVLLNALGIEDYGVYNVVAGFVSLFSFLNATLSSCTQRFYNYEGTIKGSEGFQNIFNTALLSHFAIAFIIIILLETFGFWYVNHIMVVPTDRLSAANVLFQMSTFSLALMIMQIPFSGAVMAKERMDFFAIVSLIDVFLKLFIAFIVSWTKYDNLIIYGILLASVSLLDITIYYCYCKHNFKEMKFSRHFEKNIFKSMISFSGWNLIGTFAFMLKGQGVNILLNYFFGPLVNAARGIAYQVNSAISGFSSNIYTAFGPQVVSSYAEHDYARTKKIMITESKVCFSLIALLIIPVIFEIDFLLPIWLGDAVPSQTSLFSTLVLVDTLICSLNTPCTQVVQATGKIKEYQIGSTIVNLFLLPFSWYLLKHGMPAESAFISIILFSSINQIVCVILVNRQFEIGLSYYFKEVILRCIILILILPILPLLIYILLPSTFIRFIILSLSSVLYSAYIIYLVMFNQHERKIIISLMQNTIRSINKFSR